MKDTAPEVNAFLFRRMMELGPAERLRKGMDMTATARALVWASLPEHLSNGERRIAFYERFYGEPWPAGLKG